MTTLTKVQHTPGPWGCEKDIKGTWYVTDPQSDNNDLLAIMDDEHTREDLGQSAAANARLIAAAPELLEACLAARERMHGMQEDALLDKLHAAIQKAYGERAL